LNTPVLHYFPKHREILRKPHQMSCDSATASALVSMSFSSIILSRSFNTLIHVWTVALLMWAPLQASPRLETEVSWVGNTLPGMPNWVPQDIEGMTVLADGTIFTNVPWEEGGGNVTAIKDGKVLGNAGHTHGWGNQGGRAVAANEKYLFIGCQMENEGGGLVDAETWPPKGQTWFGISRRPRADIRAAAPFPGGKGGKGDTLKQSFLVVEEKPDHVGLHFRSMAADASQVFVLEGNGRKVWRVEAETMKLSLWTTFEYAPLDALAMASDGTLCGFIGSPGNQERMGVQIFEAAETFGQALGYYRFPKGTQFGEKTAFATDAAGNFLTASPREQIIRRWQREGKDQLRELASVAGIKPFNQLSAIGTDAAGNIYAAHHGSTGGGSTLLECYTPDQKLRWKLHGLTFVDMADFDPADETRLFTKEERFQIDHKKPPGKDWTYEDYTVDAKYDEDPRRHIWSAGAWARRIAGHPFLFVNDMNSERLQVYRFTTRDGSGSAIPCGLFSGKHLTEKKYPNWPPNQPAQGEWCWCDRNGDGKFTAGEYLQRTQNEPSAQGWWVDTKGDVWRASEKAGIRCVAFAGLISDGVPEWHWEKPQTFPHPTEFQEVKRLRYDAASDVMYLGGTTKEHKNQHWKPMGPVIARYDNWRKDPKLRWSITLPYAQGSQGHESCEPMGFDVAGDYLFVPYTGASKSTGFKTGHVEVFKTSDGSAVGWMEPSAEIGEIGLQDIRECLTARKLADGRYAILLEDDFKAKLVLYRWRP
jgi:hypothetical protein